MTESQLCAAAVAMLERAYCPYSRFPVGAALECTCLLYTSPSPRD